MQRYRQLVLVGHLVTSRIYYTYTIYTHKHTFSLAKHRILQCASFFFSFYHGIRQMGAHRPYKVDTNGLDEHHHLVNRSLLPFGICHPLVIFICRLFFSRIRNGLDHNITPIFICWKRRPEERGAEEKTALCNGIFTRPAAIYLRVLMLLYSGGRRRVTNFLNKFCFFIKYTSQEY